MGSVLTSGVLSHIQEGKADITQERYIWNRAEMPPLGTSLLQILFSRKGTLNYQNGNPKLAKIGPKLMLVGQIQGKRYPRGDLNPVRNQI